MDKQVYTVSELNTYVDNLLRRDDGLQNIGLVGELSGFKRHSSGHMYFSLKDKEALVRCVMFRSSAEKLKLNPSDGMKVLLTGYVSLYKRDGQFQFYCSRMEEQGLGKLYEEFERLKLQLLKEGLFSKERKKPLPGFVRCVGIVTSPTGAAIRDMVDVAHRRNPGVKILLYPAAVQGQGAALEVARGIAALNAYGGVDVIIVGRGGGSIEDLWAFNEEVVARAIYESEVPVVSAVGHETDITISDYAADVRAATPSVAAELSVPDVYELKLRVAAAGDRMQRGYRRTLDYKANELEHMRMRLESQNPLKRLQAARERVNGVNRLMRERILGKQQRAQHSLNLLNARLTGLDPTRVLGRGFAMTVGADGNVISSAQELSIGQNIKLIYRDSNATVEVITTETAAERGAQ